MLNKRAVHTPNVKFNPEGALAYDLSGSPLALFTSASGFKLEKDFYNTPVERLNDLTGMIDAVKDTPLLCAYAHFLNEFLGIKLSPVIILTHVVISRELNTRDRTFIRKAVLSVFDRPDKFANAFGYAKFKTGSVKKLPPFFKKALRDAFQRLKEHTLVHNLMVKREIKTADLIKLLHPRPATTRMSVVYKAIIENDRKVISRSATDLVRVLSSDIDKDEKAVIIGDNLDKVSINALIRNLRNVPVTDESLEILAQRFNSVLKVSNGVPEIRIVNPFDLLKAGLNQPSSAIAEIINNSLYKYMSQVSGLDSKKVSVMIDISGSMLNSDTDTVALYMAMLSPMLLNSFLSIRPFGNRLYANDNTVVNNYRFSNSMISNYGLIKSVFKSRNEGTQLASSVRECAKQNPDLIILFSDEVGWMDYGADNLIDVNIPVLCINPRPKSFSTFNPRSQVLRIGSLDAKIFYYLTLLGNEKQFNSWVLSLI